MLKKFKIYIVFISIMLAIVGSLNIFNEQILRANTIGLFKAAVILFFPPDDLYVPLLDESYSDDQMNVVFKNKYYGRHAIGLYLDNFDSNLYFDDFDLDVNAKLLCITDSSFIYKNSTNNGIPFIGKLKSGYILFKYLTPDDLPIDKNINCKLSIDLDKNISDKYGPAHVFVKKISDL